MYALFWCMFPLNNHLSLLLRRLAALNSNYVESFWELTLKRGPSEHIYVAFPVFFLFCFFIAECVFPIVFKKMNKKMWEIKKNAEIALELEPSPVQIYIFVLKANQNIFTCFRKFSQLMPNLGLKMLLMLHEDGRNKGLNSWVILTGFISFAAQMPDPDTWIRG